MSLWTDFRDISTHYVLPVAAGVGAGFLTANPMIGVGTGATLLGAAAAHDQLKLNRENAQRSMAMSEQQMAHDKEMLKLNQNYSSPANQAALMREAGFNPYVSAGDGTIQPSNSSLGSSSSIGSFPASAMVSPMQQFMPSVQSLASAFKDLADAKKTGVDTKILEESMKDILRKLKTDADFAEFSLNMEKLLKPQELKNLEKVWEKMESEVLLNLSNKDLNSVEKSIKKIQRDILKNEKWLSDNERAAISALGDYFEKRALALRDKPDLENQLLKSQKITSDKQGVMYENMGTAAIMQGEAAKIDAISNQKYRDSMIKLNDLDYNIRSKTQYLEVYHKQQSIINDLTHQDLLNEELRATIRVLGQQRDNLAEQHDWIGVSALTGSISSLLIGYGALKYTSGSSTPKGSKVEGMKVNGGM